MPNLAKYYNLLFLQIEKAVYHEKFDNRTLDNDIALLKMKTEATFTINIQPACLWNVHANERFTSKSIMGTVSF